MKLTLFFIDPSYTVPEERKPERDGIPIYALNHDLLFQKCTRLKGGFIMTYDNAREVYQLARKYDLQAKPIAMKRTHHAEMTELVIGRYLSWMAGIKRVWANRTRFVVPCQPPHGRIPLLVINFMKTWGRVHLARWYSKVCVSADGCEAIVHM